MKKCTSSSSLEIRMSQLDQVLLVNIWRQNVFCKQLIADWFPTIPSALAADECCWNGSNVLIFIFASLSFQTNCKMSSNYRILVYFLSTMNESLRISLGLRNTRNFYKRLSFSARQNQNKNPTRRYRNVEVNQSGLKVTGIRKPNVRPYCCLDVPILHFNFSGQCHFNIWQLFYCRRRNKAVRKLYCQSCCEKEWNYLSWSISGNR